MAGFDPNTLFPNGVVDQSDLTTYFNLTVKLPKRIIDINSTSNTSYNGTLMEGSTRNGVHSYMDTSFVDISFTDATNGLKNRELFGVSSIEIGFDTSFHPRVAINFIDVKGASLIKYMENNGGNNEDAMNAFFSSLFYFPYPQFKMTIKGYYGAPVEFDLRVMNFDASFDGNTGNYIVKVDFIGDKYGVLSDIPMSLITVAPYLVDTDGTLKKDGYFDEYKFRENNESIPTFLEIVKIHNDFLKLDALSKTEDDNTTITLGGKNNVSVKEIKQFAGSITKNYAVKYAYESLKEIKETIQNIIDGHELICKQIIINEGETYGYYKEEKYVVKRDDGSSYGYNGPVYLINMLSNEHGEIEEFLRNAEEIKATIEHMFFGYSDGETEDPIETITRHVKPIIKKNICEYIGKEKWYVSFDELQSNLFYGECTALDIESLRPYLYEQNKNMITYGKDDTSTQYSYDAYDNSYYTWKSGQYNFNGYGTPVYENNAVNEGRLFNIAEKKYYTIKVENEFYTTSLDASEKKDKTTYLKTYNKCLKLDNVSYDKCSIRMKKTVSAPGHSSETIWCWEEQTECYANLRNSIKKQIDYELHKELDKIHIFILPCEFNISSIDTLLTKLKPIYDNAVAEGTFSSLDFFKTCFGFSPTIPNIVEIVFAHVDYFFRRLKQVYNNCFAFLPDRKIPNNIESDVTGIDFLPPFALVSERKQSINGYKLEKVYPPTVSYFKKPESGAYNYPDIEYIEQLYSTLRKYGITMNKMEIAARNAENISFTRLIPSDCLLEENPYDIIDPEGENDNNIGELTSVLYSRMRQSMYLSNYVSIQKFITDDVKFNLTPVLRNCLTDVVMGMKSEKNINTIIEGYKQTTEAYFDNVNSHELNEEGMTLRYPPEDEKISLFFTHKMQPFNTEKEHWCDVEENKVNMNISDSSINIPSIETEGDGAFKGDGKENLVANAAVYVLSKLPNSRPMCFEKINKGGNTVIKLTPYETINDRQILKNIYIIRIFWVLKLGAYWYLKKTFGVVPKHFCAEIISNETVGYPFDDTNIEESTQNGFMEVFKKWVSSEGYYEICKDVNIWGFSKFYTLDTQNGGIKLTNQNTFNENSGDPFETETVFLMMAKSKLQKTENLSKKQGDFEEYINLVKDSSIGTVSEGASFFETEESSNDSKGALYYHIKDLGDKYMHDAYNDMFIKGNDDSYISSKNILCLDSFMNDISRTSFVDVNRLVDIIKQSTKETPSRTVIQFLSDAAESNRFLFLTMPFNHNTRTDDMWKSVFNTYPWGDNFSANEGIKNTIIFYKSNEDSFISHMGDFSDDSLSENDTELLNTNSFDVDYGRQSNSFFKGISMNMGGSISTEETIANTLTLSSSQIFGGNTTTIRAGGINLYDIYKSRSYKVSIEMMGCPNITPFMYFNLRNIPMYSGIYRIINVSHKITPNDFTTSISGIKVNKYSIKSNDEIGALFSLIVSTLGNFINISTDSNAFDEILKQSAEEIYSKWYEENKNLFDDSTYNYSVINGGNKTLLKNISINAAFRQYNPGGIKREVTATLNHMGEYSSKCDGCFRLYSDMAIGYAQYFDNIKRTFLDRGITDLPTLIYKYAPPKDNNDTLLYVQKVIKHLKYYYEKVLNDSNTSNSISSTTFVVSDDEKIMKSMAFAQSSVEIGCYDLNEGTFDKYMRYNDGTGAQDLKYSFLDAINMGWKIYANNFEYFNMGDGKLGIPRRCLTSEEYDNTLNYPALLGK